MSLIPSYDQVGIVAPIILVIVRLFQGISAGGQFGNLMVISSENNPIRCAGLNVSIAFSTSIFGFVMASGVSYLSVHLFASHLNSLVWRFPFSFGAVLLIIFLLLREKDQKKVSLANHRSPLLYLLNQYKKHLITSTILATVTLMIYYVDITYMTTYLVKVLGFSLSESLAMNTVAIFFMFLVTPLFGLISANIDNNASYLILCFISFFIYIIFFSTYYVSYIYRNVTRSG
jgi:MHS family proline/betaine transporter-like MFS transporter